MSFTHNALMLILLMFLGSGKWKFDLLDTS